MRKFWILLCMLTAFAVPRAASATNTIIPSYSLNSSNQFVLAATATGATSVDFYWDGVLVFHDTSAPFQTTRAGSNGHKFEVIGTWTTAPLTVYAQGNWPVLPEVASGTQTNCAQVAGQLYCWGYGAAYCQNAEAGGSPSGCVDISVPALAPFYPSPTKSLAMLQDGGCAISNVLLSNNTGDIEVWGKNDYGVVGFNPATTPFVSPRALTSGGGYVQVTSGDDFLCALSSAGGVKCIGSGRETNEKKAPPPRRTAAPWRRVGLLGTRAASAPPDTA